VIAWVRRSNAEATESRFKVHEGAFMQLIAQARADGFASTAGDVTPGLGAIAMAIPSPMGQAPIALGVGGPVGRLRRKRDAIVIAMREFAASFHAPPPQS
jgi:DNA-binding IclR family transcriptional regulator